MSGFGLNVWQAGLPWLSTDRGIGGGGGADAFSPSSIDDLTLDLDGDSGITLDGSSKVSAWADQSGTGNDAGQSTAAARPDYTASDATANGRGTVNFDGTTPEWLLIPDSDTLEPGAGGITVYVVFYAPAQSDTDRTILSKFDPSQEWLLQLDYSGGTTRILQRNAADSAYYIAASGVADDGSIHALRYRYDGSGEAGLRLDAGAETTDTDTGHLTGAGKVSIGARDSATRQPATINVARVLIYQRQLTSDEDTQVMDYLTARYGL